MSSACLNAFCFLALFFVAGSLGNVPEGASPSQIYITQRPEPIARYSDNKAAQVNIQILMPAVARYIYVVMCFYYAESDGSLGNYTLYRYRSLTNSKDMSNVMVDRDDLKIRVEEEEVPGFMKVDIAIEAQMTGEIRLAYAMPGAHEIMTVEVLDQQQQIWAEDLNYHVQFFRMKGEFHLKIGEEFPMLCLAYGPYITAEDVSITKNGELLPGSKLTYRQQGRAKATIDFLITEFDEGEFECRVQDATTGAVDSAVVSVIRN